MKMIKIQMPNGEVFEIEEELLEDWEAEEAEYCEEIDCPGVVVIG